MADDDAPSAQEAAQTVDDDDVEQAVGSFNIDALVEKFRGVFDAELEMQVTGDEASGFEISGSQAGSNMTLLGVKVVEDDENIDFTGIDVTFRKPMPMFEDGGNAFLKECSRMQMRGAYTFRRRKRYGGNKVIDGVGTTSYFDDQNKRSVEEDKEGTMFTFIGDDEERFNEKQMFGWKYPKAKTKAEIETREETLDEFDRLGIGPRPMFASAGNLAFEAASTGNPILEGLRQAAAAEDGQLDLTPNQEGEAAIAELRAERQAAAEQLQAERQAAAEQQQAEQQAAAEQQQAAAEAAEQAAAEKQAARTARNDKRIGEMEERQEIRNFNNELVAENKARKEASEPFFKWMNQGETTAQRMFKQVDLKTGVFTGMVNNAYNVSLVSLAYGAVVWYATSKMLSFVVTSQVPKDFQSSIEEEKWSGFRTEAKWVSRIAGGISFLFVTYNFPLHGFALGALKSLSAGSKLTSWKILTGFFGGLFSWTGLLLVGVPLLLVLLGGVALGLRAYWKKPTPTSDEVLQAYSNFKEEFEKEATRDDLTVSSLKKLKAEANTLFQKAPDFYVRKPGADAESMGPKENLFTLVVDQLIAEEEKRDRASLFNWLLETWGPKAAVEPEWQGFSEAEYMRMNPTTRAAKKKETRATRIFQLREMYSKLPSERDKALVQTYMGLMTSRFSKDQLYAVDKVKVVDDDASRFAPFAQGGAKAKAAAETNYKKMKKEILYGEERKDWFLQKPEEIFREVRPALRRYLEFLRFDEENLAGTTIDLSLKLQEVKCKVEFAKRSVRATASVKAFTGTDAEKNPDAEALAGSLVEKKKDDYVSTATSNLLRPGPDGSTSNAILLEAAVVQVNAAMQDLATLFQKNDYYFSLEGTQAVADPPVDAAEEATTAEEPAKAVEDTDTDSTDTEGDNTPSEGSDAAKEAEEQEEEEDEEEEEPDSAMQTWLEMAESSLAPAAPGPDLDALLADHAQSMRRVRDLLEVD